ncbi:MAG: signal peptidase I [Deltaproteobacteria bacterium]|nr:signal peptidase I [Deltaproteobacteria bacterium]
MSVAKDTAKDPVAAEASREAQLVGAADAGFTAYYREAGLTKVLAPVVGSFAILVFAQNRLHHQDYLLGSLGVFLAVFVLSTITSQTPWGARRGARGEAKALLRSGEKLLKKHRAQLQEPAAKEVESALSAVRTSLAGDKALPTVETRAVLDQKLDQHLGFARKSAAREYTESIGGAILVALLLRAFVFEPFHIPSGSMIPTLLVGDFIFVNKMAYGLRIPFTDPSKVHKIFEGMPKRGDVVVFIVPKSPDLDYVKRVIGLPGDTIEVDDNEVWVNGIKLNHEGQSDYHYTEHSEYTDTDLDLTAQNFHEDLFGVKHDIITRGDPSYSRNGKWVVEPGKVFMMGDNRDNSLDSRVENGIGQIPLSYLKGRASSIWISFGGPHAIRFDRFFKSVR